MASGNIDKSAKDKLVSDSEGYDLKIASMEHKI